MDVKEWFDTLINTDNLPGVALVIVGPRGNGKSIFADEVVSRIGKERSVYVGRVDGDFFSSVIHDRRLVVCEDTVMKNEEKLKRYITEPEIELHRKGQDMQIVRNVSCFLITANKFTPRADDRYFIVTDLEKARYAYTLASTTGA